MRIGIIGCGFIGNKRSAAAAGHEIVIVADTDLQRAQSLAEKTGAKATGEWREVVDADIDIAIIATTHDILPEITLAAVEGGKHVLVEKPAARTAQELYPVARAAEKNNRIIKVGFNHRFHPALQKAHRLFTDGEIGELMYIRGRYGHGGRVGYEQEWRCDRDISGGGELIDQGSHLIDLSRWFIGDMNLDYSYAPTYFWDTDVDDNCFLALKSQSGQMAWLHATWTEWKNCFSFEIYGRDGKLAIEGLGGSYGVEKLTWYKMLPEMGPPDTTSWEFPGADLSWQREFAEFEASIKENRQPVGNIQDAIAMLEIIDGVYEGDNPLPLAGRERNPG